MTAHQLKMIIHALRLDYTKVAKDMNYSPSTVRNWIYRDRIPDNVTESIIEYLVLQVKEQGKHLDVVDNILLKIGN